MQHAQSLRIRTIKLAFFSLCLASACFALAQGPLTPPGAPMPTMKSLDQIEPRTAIHNIDLPLSITQPGSYYLAENINFTKTGVDAITILSNNVTIDLHGFTLAGPGKQSSPPSSAIATSLQNNYVGYLTIMNGVITNWPGDGIRLGTPTPTVFDASTYKGWGSFSTIYRIMSHDNGGNGIYSGWLSIITECNIDYNLASGLMAPWRSIIKDCIIHANTQNGIVIMGDCTVTDNSISDNGIMQAGTTGAGIYVPQGTAPPGGIYGRHRIERNHLDGNYNGIDIESGDAFVTGNVVYYSQAGNQANYIFNGAKIVAGPVLNATAAGTNFSPIANIYF